MVFLLQKYFKCNIYTKHKFHCFIQNNLLYYRTAIKDSLIWLIFEQPVYVQRGQKLQYSSKNYSVKSILCLLTILTFSMYCACSVVLSFVLIVFYVTLPPFIAYKIKLFLFKLARNLLRENFRPVLPPPPPPPPLYTKSLSITTKSKAANAVKTVPIIFLVQKWFPIFWTRPTLPVYSLVCFFCKLFYYY